MAYQGTLKNMKHALVYIRSNWHYWNFDRPIASGASVPPGNPYTFWTSKMTEHLHRAMHLARFRACLIKAQTNCINDANANHCYVPLWALDSSCRRASRPMIVPSPRKQCVHLWRISDQIDNFKNVEGCLGFPYLKIKRFLNVPTLHLWLYVSVRAYVVLSFFCLYFVMSPLVMLHWFICIFKNVGATAFGVPFVRKCIFSIL